MKPKKIGEHFKMFSNQTYPPNSNCYGYIRVSTKKQVQFGFSLQTQRSLIEEWVIKNGHHLIKIFEDAGISGNDDSNRADYIEMIRSIKKGEILIFTYTDRMSRSKEDWDFLSVYARDGGFYLHCLEYDDPNCISNQKMAFMKESFRRYFKTPKGRKELDEENHYNDMLDG